MFYIGDALQAKEAAIDASPTIVVEQSLEEDELAVDQVPTEATSFAVDQPVVEAVFAVSAQELVETDSPTIDLDPDTGFTGTDVTVFGEGWQAQSMVYIFLMTLDEVDAPAYQVATLTANQDGVISGSFSFPSERNWEDQDSVVILAQEAASGVTAEAFFEVLSLVDLEVVGSADSATPHVTAVTDLNIRSGPGTNYAIVGMLSSGQTAKVTGVSTGGYWWQIDYPAWTGGYGWVSASYVTAENTSGIPAVAAPALPTTVWTDPLVITDWLGEYYDNPYLSGSPVVVRNDASISFDWGSGSPDSMVPEDDFSVRWSQTLSFSYGNYSFYITADDGVRLYIDGSLVIDEWHSSSSNSYSAGVTLSEGLHSVIVEYYEDGGSAAAYMTWGDSTNQDPVAVLNGPYITREGEWVSFDGSDSTDDDGTIESYEWDFDYDGSDFSVDATGSTAVATYPDGPETYTLALRVTDDAGDSHIDTALVRVANVDPTVALKGSYSSETGSPVVMVGLATDPGTADQLGLTYLWDFGDGTQGSGLRVSHTYQQAGTYSVALTVTDKDGAQGTGCTTVYVTDPVSNQQPTAVINGSTSGLVGDALNFSALKSGDPDGKIVSYTWDFGDGDTSSGVGVKHTYTAPGSYVVTLTVTDDDGMSASTTLAVVVTEPVANQPPIVSINGSVSGLVGEALRFSAAQSSDPDGRIVRYAWDFGDGTTDNGVVARHAYAAAGSYVVTLMVTDNSGVSESATITVQIVELASDQP